MKKQVLGIAAVVVGLAVLVGGVATASNMGFKFVPNVGANSAFNLSLPWNNNYTNAESLYADIASQASVASVAKLNADSTLSAWLGLGNGGSNFPLVKGEAYVVNGGPGGNTPVIVGSHDPNFTFTFAPGAFNASAPYHQTYTNAEGVYAAISATCPGAVANVAKINPDSTLSAWLGLGNGGSNFPLDLGAGVVVNTTAACSGFVWAHY